MMKPDQMFRRLERFITLVEAHMLLRGLQIMTTPEQPSQSARLTVAVDAIAAEIQSEMSDLAAAWAKVPADSPEVDASIQRLTDLAGQLSSDNQAPTTLPSTSGGTTPTFT